MSKPLDRAYFERKKDPEYDDDSKYTKCCTQSKYQKTMMKGDEEDWKLIERYIKQKLNDYPDTISITPTFCDKCNRFKEYISKIDTGKKW